MGGVDTYGRSGMTTHGDGVGRNMAKVPKNAKQARPRKRAGHSGTAHLDTLIAEATVDCYNESEEITGIFAMLEESLAIPFTTTLLGVEVTVDRFDLNDTDKIVAVCRRGRERLRVLSSTCLCPSLNRKGQNGSMPTGNGLNGNDRCPRSDMKRFSAIALS